MSKNVTMLEKKVFNESIKLSSGLLISAPKGKMIGVMTLTTSMLINENCLKRINLKGSICENCFSYATLKDRKNVRDAYSFNTEYLSKGFLSKLDHKEISFLIDYYGQNIFRFESHGDLVNVIHLLNYFNIAKNKPGCSFSLWTKNIFIVKNIELLYKYTGLKEYQKPDNLNILGSALYLNDNRLFVECTYIDKVFTVYNSKNAYDDSITINCGSKNCDVCRLCYSKNDTYYVNELLKKEAGLYYKLVEIENRKELFFYTLHIKYKNCDKKAVRSILCKYDLNKTGERALLLEAYNLNIKDVENVRIMKGNK